MRLTTKGRYAVTAMLDLALNGEQGPVSVVEVCSRQGIPGAYLEQIFARLRRAGCIESVRGPGGGYVLAAGLGQISISDILVAVGEGVDATRCHGAADCQDGTQCLTHDLWSELSDQIDGFLRSITLDSLVRRVGDQGHDRTPKAHARNHKRSAVADQVFQLIEATNL
jgi:Rrf2 family transcriptional regulator, iron-sulfur cluster assembly transcription factor